MMLMSELFNCLHNSILEALMVGMIETWLINLYLLVLSFLKLLLVIESLRWPAELISVMEMKPT